MYGFHMLRAAIAMDIASSGRICAGWPNIPANGLFVGPAERASAQAMAEPAATAAGRRFPAYYPPIARQIPTVSPCTAEMRAAREQSQRYGEHALNLWPCDVSVQPKYWQLPWLQAIPESFKQFGLFGLLQFVFGRI